MSTNDDTELKLEPRVRSAFEHVRPMLDQIQKADLVPMNVDPVRALTIVRGVAVRLRPLRDPMLTLPGFNIDDFDNLDLYTRALMQANALYACAKAPPTELSKVAEEATQLKETFISDIASLVKRGLLRGHRFKAVPGRPSYRNLASDLLTLANILRTYMEKDSPRSTTSFEELDRAEILVENLNALLGARRRTPEELAAATLERQKAYALMARAYDQVRKAVAYLRWGNNDADELAPALNRGRKGARKKRTNTVEPVKETAVSLAAASLLPEVAETPPVSALPYGPNDDPFVH